MLYPYICVLSYGLFNWHLKSLLEPDFAGERRSQLVPGPGRLRIQRLRAAGRAAHRGPVEIKGFPSLKKIICITLINLLLLSHIDLHIVDVVVMT